MLGRPDPNQDDFGETLNKIIADMMREGREGIRKAEATKRVLYRSAVGLLIGASEVSLSGSRTEKFAICQQVDYCLRALQVALVDA